MQHQADRSSELIFVCDGATWIWKLVTHFSPNAVQIVDWYHDCQYLHAVADELSHAEKENWLMEMNTCLWEGQIEDIIQECRSLCKHIGRPAERLISNYTNNLERMQ